MKLFLGLWILITPLVLAPSASARDLITARTLLKDPSGTLTIAEVAHSEGTPVGPFLTKGSTDAVYWMRLQVHAPAQGTRFVLFIRPSFLNDVRLYEADPGSPTGWKIRVTGNYYPYSQRERVTTSLGFLVTATAPETTCYLRFQSKSPLAVNVEAMAPEEADLVDHRRDLVEVFFVTSMLFLFIWAIHSYLLDRQRLVGFFALHQAVYTLFGIVATGYLAPVAPTRLPHLVDWVTAILYLTISLTALLFCRELFRPYRPSSLLMRVLGLLPWTFPILLVLLLLGYEVAVININATLIKLAWLCFVMTAFTLRAERSPSRRVLQVFFVFIWVANFIFWYTNHVADIAFKANLTAVQILIVDGLLIGGLFAWVLHTQARQTLRDGQQSALNLLLVQKKFEIEQELKKQIEIQAQTDYLTGLFNRRRFVELAERELTRAIRARTPLTLLVIDIDRFKQINDTWGHCTGDEVLQRVSSIIRDTLREEDILGRTGGEEFAIVLTQIEGSEALDIAQRLCAAVAGATIAPSGIERIPVSLSIGITELQDRSIGFNKLLDEADAAMYKAKQTGRNRPFLNC